MDGPSWRDRMRYVLANPRGRIVVLAACVALGVLLATGGWWFGVGRYGTAPQFTTLSKVDAVGRAQQSGFTLKYDGGRYDEKIPKDTVLDQRPGPGARIVKGGTVTLTLSLGPERYPVPDILGKSYDLAVADLTARKLVPIRRDAYDDNMPAGNVLAVDPKVGVPGRPGDKVTVTVSRGKAPITIPNVTGRNVDEARPALIAMGLLVDVQEKESDKPKGQVLEQSPAEGAGVVPGATVKLVVSSGPKQVPMPGVKTRACAEGKAALEALGLRVSVQGANPNGTVIEQNPAEGTPVPAGTEVVIWCF